MKFLSFLEKFPNVTTGWSIVMGIYAFYAVLPSISGVLLLLFNCYDWLYSS